MGIWSKPPHHWGIWSSSRWGFGHFHGFVSQGLLMDKMSIVWSRRCINVWLENLLWLEATTLSLEFMKGVFKLFAAIGKLSQLQKLCHLADATSLARQMWGYHHSSEWMLFERKQSSYSKDLQDLHARCVGNWSLLTFHACVHPVHAKDSSRCCLYYVFSYAEQK